MRNTELMDRFLRRAEPWMFLVLLIAQLAVIWSLPAFLTLDGPGHIYNMHALSDLLANDHSVYAPWYEPNLALLPNWISYVLAQPVLNLFSPAQIEQWLVSWSVIALAMGFRYFFRSIDSAKPWGSWLIFFFTFHGPLLNGFLNFSIGLGVAFFALGQLIRAWERTDARRLIAFAVILVVLYFSHFVAFGLFAFSSIGVGFSWLMDALRKGSSELQVFGKKAGMLLLAALPAGAWCVWYVVIDNQSSQKFYLSTQEIIAVFTDDMGLKTYNPNELLYLRWIWIATAAGLFLQFIAMRFFGAARAEKSSHQRGWLWATLIVAAMAFVLPNGTSGGGIVTFRVVLTAYILFFSWCLWWIAHTYIRLAVLTVILIAGFDHLRATWHYEEGLQSRIGAMMKAGAGMAPQSVLAVVDFDQVWPFNHVPSYVGCAHNQPMTVVLGGQKFFSPLRFKGDLFSEPMIEQLEVNPALVNPIIAEQTLPSPPDYWLCMGIPERAIADTSAARRWQSFFSESCVLFAGDSVHKVFVYQRYHPIQ
jgi:hypothetical protein